MIKENINYVEQVIDKACMESGRNRRDVTLIAVSKTKPVEMLQEAYETGCRDFGENKVQELVDKYEVMPKDIRWHMIGHLQRNKVKYIIDKVYLIHSVDSLRLAEEISKEAIKKAVDVNILIEVNVAGEESKFGTSMEEAKKLVRDVAKLPNVYIKGLMTIAPFVEKAPLPRYGSGGLFSRICAATWPTACLSMPLTMIVLLSGTSKVMPLPSSKKMECE